MSIVVRFHPTGMSREQYQTRFGWNIAAIVLDLDS
jgi:hypothetical protein